jgi:ribosomal protein S18 acetylase RimI-like enzyme
VPRYGRIGDTRRRLLEDLRFRNATVADLPAVVALLADDALGSSREDPGEPLDTAYLDAFRDMQAQDGNDLVVAVDSGGRVIGCVQYMVLPHISRLGTRRAQIEGVRVAGDLRGKGVGRRLLEHVIERARDDGCGLLQLNADASREDAQRFYQSLELNPSHVGMKLSL